MKLCALVTGILLLIAIPILAYAYSLSDAIIVATGPNTVIHLPLAHPSVEFMPATPLILTPTRTPRLAPPPPKPTQTPHSSNFSLKVDNTPPELTHDPGKFDYGIQVAAHGDTQANIQHIKTLGLNWVKFQMPWYHIEPLRYEYHWDLWDHVIESYAENDIKIMLSITKAPYWANSDETITFGSKRFPLDPADYADFVMSVAYRYEGKIQAIELWNEPNLWIEVGGAEHIDPAKYVNLLQITYPQLKEFAPEIMIISAGLSPGGDRPTLAMDDVDYLEQMYQLGGQGYFDALGAHPFGFNCPALADWRTVTPEEAGAPPESGLFTNRHQSWCFQGTLEAYREIMVAHGDASKPIIITEFGWAVASNPHPGYEYARDNTPQEQAQWIVEAYDWASMQPWLGPMILWNLDYVQVAPDTEQAQFSIVGRQAYEAIYRMRKR